MNSIQQRIGSQRGLVLFSSLLILSLLIIVGVGGRVMLQNDYRILANLKASTEAFYVADAGIEWAKHRVAQIVTHPPSPANHSQPFSSGSFHLSFNSPTGVTPLVAKISLDSTGTVAMSSQTIRAQITKSYDLADSAVGLRGHAQHVGFSGDSYLVSGMDHDPENGAVIAGSKPRHAISVSDDKLRQVVDAGLGSEPSPRIVGGGADVPAVAKTDFMSAPAIVELVNELCSAAHSLSTVVPANGILFLENQTWGSRSSPQLRCIDGLPDSGDSVQLGGNVTGAGILVIRNAEVLAQGSFHWEGWVIVTGNNVGFKATGTASKEILGSLLVNETGSPATGVSILDIQGALRLLFSRPALARAAELIPTSTLANAYQALPFSVTQNYWKAVTP